MGYYKQDIAGRTKSKLNFVNMLFAYLEKTPIDENSMKYCLILVKV
jgi:hypothetical protein